MTSIKPLHWLYSSGTVQVQHANGLLKKYLQLSNDYKTDLTKSILT